jgi:hypothetical protein
MAVVVPEYTAVAEQIYIAYFGRPADRAGLINMTNLLATGQAPTAITDIAAAYYTNGAVKAIFDSFGASTESTTLYTGTDAQFIVSIYHNVLGRDPLLTGLDFWTNALATHQMTRAEAAIQIMAAAQANATDAATIANKTTVATNFTAAIDTAAEDLGYNGKAAAQTARDMLSTVNSTTNTTDFNATVTATLAGLSGTGGTAYTLTTSQDVLVGSAGNDTFTAVVSQNGAGTLINSLQGVDSLDGGAGVDTLNVTLDATAAAAADVVAPTLKNIENVNLRVTKAGSALNFIGSTGVTNVTIQNSTAATGTIDNVGSAALAVKNQNTTVTFDHATGSSLSLSLDTVGSSAAHAVVDLGKTAAAAATSLSITANNAYENITSTTAGGVLTVNIAATGTNEINLVDAAAATTVVVTGTGSVDLSGQALTALKTLTAGDGGVTVTGTSAAAAALTATTGAGADTLVFNGANVKSISTGAGNDSVTLGTGALAAAATVSLGAGDDTLTLSVAPTGGVTLDGGTGTDTLAVTGAIYTSISAFTAAQLAKVTNFEVLGITNALTATTYDVSKIAGVGSFAALDGVGTGLAAIASNLSANSSVTLAGDLVTNNGSLAVSFKTDTAADVLNLVLKGDYTESNDTTATVTTITSAVDTSAIETLNVTSTGNASDDFLGAGAAGTNVADSVKNVLTLTDDALVTLKVTGNQAFSFISTASETKLATIDASALTAGATINASAALSTSSALNIKGSATASNSLTGGAGADTIVGGAKADTITGGAGGDTLTGAGGNDTFVFAAGNSSIGTGTSDTITDFVANTAANAGGTAAGATLGGDVLAFTHTGTTVAANGFKVFVASSAADATTFLANTASTSNTQASAALDSTGQNLYVDVSGDGVADFYIHLTGVSTLTAAAFTLA